MLSFIRSFVDNSRRELLCRSLRIVDSLQCSLSARLRVFTGVITSWPCANVRCRRRRAAVVCQRQLLYRRRLLAVTFDVCCILSTEFDDYSEHLHHFVRVRWNTSRTGASRFVVYHSKP